MSESQHPHHRSLKRLQAAFWRRRLLLWLVRAAWLMMLVPLIVMAGFYWRGWQIRPVDLVLGMALVALITVLWAIRPIRLAKMVQRLDTRLNLQTRLLTAFEVTERGQADDLDENVVVQRLLQESVHLIGQIRSQITILNHTLWLEMRTLIGITALLMALIFLNTINPRLPDSAPVELSPPWQEPTAEEVLPPDVNLPPPPPSAPETLSEAQLQSILEILAAALRDEATTRAIADALDRSDIPAASTELRRLADQLDELSAVAQQTIGERLQEAADNIDEMMPILTQALQAGSQALAQGDSLAGGEALETVADILESLEATPVEVAEAPPAEALPQDTPAETQPEPGEAEQEPEDQPGEPEEAESDAGGGGDEAGAGEEAAPEQPTEEERLAAEAEPLELESEFELEERVLQPAELDAGASDQMTQDSPFARRATNQVDDLGADSLAYPWEKREVIRSYFSP